eukprot:TRINITY_DN4535_c0_g1_i1.p1 TRINITY_DN4535_c0_g1~~TRINITY_DN4535_c0_g1_i1.p1  ORF type:complete len:1172 (-),score=291.73 TRINITY_DN4535_c0_g1_i1:43-3558(-)
MASKTNMKNRRDSCSLDSQRDDAVRWKRLSAAIEPRTSKLLASQSQTDNGKKFGQGLNFTPIMCSPFKPGVPLKKWFTTYDKGVLPIDAVVPVSPNSKPSISLTTSPDLGKPNVDFEKPLFEDPSKRKFWAFLRKRTKTHSVPDILPSANSAPANIRTSTTKFTSSPVSMGNLQFTKVSQVMKGDDDFRKSDLRTSSQAIRSLVQIAIVSITTRDLSAQEHGLGVLLQLSFEASNHEMIIQEQALPHLVELLGIKKPIIRMLCTFTLANIALLEINQTHLRESGLISMVPDLLTSKNLDVLEKALGLTINLSCTSINRVELVKSGIIKPFLSLLLSDSSKMLELVCLALRNLFYDSLAQQDFFEQNGVAVLLEAQDRICRENNLKDHYLTLLAILCWMRPPIRKALFSSDSFMSLLVSSLSAHNLPITAQLSVLHILCSFSLEEEFIEPLVTYGVVEPLIEDVINARDKETFLLKNVGRTDLVINVLSNLSYRTKAVAFFFVGMDAIEPLVYLVDLSTPETLRIRVTHLITNISTDDQARALLMQKNVKAAFQSQVVTPNAQLKEAVSNALLNLRFCQVSNVPDINPSSGPGPALLNKLRKDANHRDRVIKEILETEKGYVENLLLLTHMKNSILGNLSQMSKSFGKKTNSSLESSLKLFSTVEALSTLHSQFLQKLTQKMISRVEGEELLVGQILLDLAKELEVYCDFVNNYNEAAQFLESCLADEETKKRVEEERQELKMKTPALWSQLITPIQRIPRYCLLVQDLLDHMPQTNEDYNNVSAALRMILKTGDMLEKTKTRAENLSKLQPLSEKIYDNEFQIVVQDREFLKEGDLIQETPQKKSKYFHLFLFSDALLITHQKGGSTPKYSVKFWFWLSHLLPELSSSSTFSPRSFNSAINNNNRGQKFYLRLNYLDTKLILYSMNSTEVTEWHEELLSAVARNFEKWELVSTPRSRSNNNNNNSTPLKSFASTSSVPPISQIQSSLLNTSCSPIASSLQPHNILDDSTGTENISEIYSTTQLGQFMLTPSSIIEIDRLEAKNNAKAGDYQTEISERSREEENIEKEEADAQKNKIFVFIEENSLTKKLNLAQKTMSLTVSVDTTFASLRATIHSHLSSTLPSPLLALFLKEEDRLRVHARKVNGKLMHFHDKEYPWRIHVSDQSIYYVYK